MAKRDLLKIYINQFTLIVAGLVRPYAIAAVAFLSSIFYIITAVGSKYAFVAGCVNRHSSR